MSKLLEINNHILSYLIMFSENINAIMSKYTLKWTKFHHFLKFSPGSIPQNTCITTPPFLSKIPPPPMFEHGFTPLHSNVPILISMQGYSELHQYNDGFNASA